MQEDNRLSGVPGKVETSWYRVLETHSYDMTKYCMRCHYPHPLWYEGECHQCRFEEEKYGETTRNFK